MELAVVVVVALVVLLLRGLANEEEEGEGEEESSSGVESVDDDDGDDKTCLLSFSCASGGAPKNKSVGHERDFVVRFPVRLRTTVAWGVVDSLFFFPTITTSSSSSCTVSCRSGLVVFVVDVVVVDDDDDDNGLPKKAGDNHDTDFFLRRGPVRVVLVLLVLVMLVLVLVVMVLKPSALLFRSNCALMSRIMANVSSCSSCACTATTFSVARRCRLKRTSKAALMARQMSMSDAPAATQMACRSARERRVATLRLLA